VPRTTDPLDDDINRLRDVLAQLSPDRQRTIVPRLIRAVEWFSELETSEPAEQGSASRSISFGFSTGRRRLS
jgi:hypothetical protein